MRDCEVLPKSASKRRFKAMPGALWPNIRKSQSSASVFGSYLGSRPEDLVIVLNLDVDDEPIDCDDMPWSPW